MQRGDPIHLSAKRGPHSPKCKGGTFIQVQRGVQFIKMQRGDAFHLKCIGGTPFTKAQRGDPIHRSAKGGPHSPKCKGNFKTEYKLEQYLTFIKNPTQRKIFTKFRISNHKLLLKYGRYQNFSTEKHLCELCKSNEVEDEYHFALSCRCYQSLRNNSPKGGPHSPKCKGGTPFTEAQMGDRPIH